MQPHIESAVLDLGRHVGVVGLPAAVGGRTRVEQPQPGLGAGVPRDVRVPEDQHVHVGETLRAPPLSPLGRPCLVNDREAHAAQVLTRHLGQPLAQLGPVVVAVHADEPLGPCLEGKQRVEIAPVPSVDDYVRAVDLLPHLVRKVAGTSR